MLLHKEGSSPGARVDVELANKAPPKPQSQDTEHLTGLKLFTLLGGLVLASILIFLDSSIISAAIPNITDEFHSLRDVGCRSLPRHSSRRDRVSSYRGRSRSTECVGGIRHSLDYTFYLGTGAGVVSWAAGWGMGWHKKEAAPPPNPPADQNMKQGNGAGGSDMEKKSEEK
ncbi:hypothetical protein ANO14919_127190 [Xylariales sp. No.14919]|nr:hypothetical protein ANO14919_127190 [Xylariales sp. No.14919]